MAEEKKQKLAVVKGVVKAIAKGQGMRVSAKTFDVLNRRVIGLIADAALKAREAKRVTVMPEDVA